MSKYEIYDVKVGDVVAKVEAEDFVDSTDKGGQHHLFIADNVAVLEFFPGVMGYYAVRKVD
jgi:hypothetical protein